MVVEGDLCWGLGMRFSLQRSCKLNLERSLNEKNTEEKKY